MPLFDFLRHKNPETEKDYEITVLPAMSLEEFAEAIRSAPGYVHDQEKIDYYTRLLEQHDDQG